MSFSLSFSLLSFRGVKTKRERNQKRVSTDRESERQARCGDKWEGARLLEEGRNWGDDLPGERNPETPRARATFLAKTLRFLSMTYPTCLCFCPFVLLSAPALVRAAPGPFSSQPLRCVPSHYSFVLPRLPSLVVLADATGDSTPRRNVTRTMISGRIFSSRFVDRSVDTTQSYFVRFRFGKFLINFDRSITLLQPFKSLKLFRSLL